jgi:hypothetical protein
VCYPADSLLIEQEKQRFLKTPSIQFIYSLKTVMFGFKKPFAAHGNMRQAAAVLSATCS